MLIQLCELLPAIVLAAISSSGFGAARKLAGDLPSASSASCTPVSLVMRLQKQGIHVHAHTHTSQDIAGLPAASFYRPWGRNVPSAQAVDSN